MITKFNDFLTEGLTDKMVGTLSQEQINQIIHEDDLNLAMVDLQEMIDVTTGDVCGVYFSKFDDADEHWENSSPEERKIMMDEYLELELSYDNLNDEDDTIEIEDDRIMPMDDQLG